MQNFFVMLAFGVISIGVALGFHTVNPPPPADYEVVYFGSPNCGTCRYWKANTLKDWKKDPASSSLKLKLATLNGSPWRGGYGKHDAEFQEAFGGRNFIGYPSFVLYKRGEVERIYSGLKGWERIEKRVRSEAKRLKKPH
ncbi:MAG: hypothetical protein AAGL90_10990 [Pseudomonadota bacterium]